MIFITLEEAGNTIARYQLHLLEYFPNNIARNPIASFLHFFILFNSVSFSNNTTQNVIKLSN